MMANRAEEGMSGLAWLASQRMAARYKERNREANNSDPTVNWPSRLSCRRAQSVIQTSDSVAINAAKAMTPINKAANGQMVTARKITATIAKYVSPTRNRDAWVNGLNGRSVGTIKQLLVTATTF